MGSLPRGKHAPTILAISFEIYTYIICSAQTTIFFYGTNQQTKRGESLFYFYFLFFFFVNNKVHDLRVQK